MPAAVCANLMQQSVPQRREQAQRMLALRARRRGMPAHWLDAQELGRLTERYGDARAARRELTACANCSTPATG
jgi:chromosome segregation protein